MDEILGLPAHPLLVHGAVVLVPLAAAGVVLIAFWPTARFRLGYAVLAIAAAGATDRRSSPNRAASRSKECGSRETELVGARRPRCRRARRPEYVSARGGGRRGRTTWRAASGRHLVDEGRGDVDHGRLVWLKILVGQAGDLVERIGDARRLARQRLEHGEPAERDVERRIAALVDDDESVAGELGRDRRRPRRPSPGRYRCAPSCAPSGRRRRRRSRTRRRSTPDGTAARAGTTTRSNTSRYAPWPEPGGSGTLMLAPNAGTIPAFAELTRPPREPAVLMDRDREHIAVGVERGLRAVAVVDVPVDDRDPPDAVRGDRVHRRRARRWRRCRSPSPGRPRRDGRAGARARRRSSRRR